jgi:hypothetical protein
MQTKGLHELLADGHHSSDNPSPLDRKGHVGHAVGFFRRNTKQQGGSLRGVRRYVSSFIYPYPCNSGHVVIMVAHTENRSLLRNPHHISDVSQLSSSFRKPLEAVQGIPQVYALGIHLSNRRLIMYDILADIGSIEAKYFRARAFAVFCFRLWSVSSHKTLGPNVSWSVPLVGRAWYIIWSRRKIAVRHARIVSHAVLTLRSISELNSSVTTSLWAAHKQSRPPTRNNLWTFPCTRLCFMNVGPSPHTHELRRNDNTHISLNFSAHSFSITLLTSQQSFL